MTDTFVAATRAQSRVFVAEGLPGPDNPPIFQGCLVMGGASQGQGDVEYIYCPDPDNYNRFIVVGEIQGREEQVETSLSGHFPLNRRSQIIKWGNAKTPLAIHVHFGTASNPQNFNVFEKSVIFDDGARITSTDIEEMGALDESDAIGQSADISAASYYEVIPLNYVSTQPGLTTEGCVDCWVEPIYDDRLPLDNRYAYYIAQKGDGATSDDAKLLYSLDGGSTWSAMAVNDIGTGDPTGVTVMNEVPIVTTGAATTWFYADILGGDTAFTLVEAGSFITAISSNGSEAYAVGPSGWMGHITDYTSAPLVITPGSVGNMTCVHTALGGAVITGDDTGVVFFAPDGVAFGSADLATLFTVVGGITAVCAQNADVAWAGTADGRLFYTTNGGNTWKERGFPGSGSGQVDDIEFPTLSVGYVTHQPTAAAARLIKTVGAGASGTWYSVPRTGSLPTVYRLKISLMRNEPNVLLGAGEAVSTLDGAGIAMLGTE